MQLDRASTLSQIDRQVVTEHAVWMQLAKTGLTDECCVVAHRAAVDAGAGPELAWDAARAALLRQLRSQWQKAVGETRRANDCAVLMFDVRAITEKAERFEQRFWQVAELPNPFRMQAAA